MLGDLRCTPIHDGPFFYESKETYRCDGCRMLVTPSQVIASARALQGGVDGNELQRQATMQARDDT